MESIITIAGFVIVMLSIWGLSHYHFYVRGPKRDVPRIMAALAHAEQVGDSDVQSNIILAAERWRYLKLAQGDSKLRKPCFKLSPEVHERVAKQIAILEPHRQALDAQVRKSNGGDFTGFDIPVGL